jgi:pimeloyl-ACP methyl ester carboxylesterase
MDGAHDRFIVLPEGSTKGGAVGTKQLERGTLQANGTELFYEARGEGAPVLLVAGGLADAGQFAALADALAKRWRVIAYDRRGNSRSPAPKGWSATSIQEQSDDAAGLLEALGISAASVYGHSIGAPIALDLAMRRPEIVTAIVLHDPAMMSVLEDPSAVMAVVGPVIGEAMQAGGPAAAADAFYRFAVGPAVDSLDPATYERMKGDGEVLFAVEFEALSGWRPADEALQTVRVPARVLTGADSPPFFGEAAEWVARRLDASVEQVQGGHGAPFDNASEVAARIADFIGGVDRTG